MAKAKKVRLRYDKVALGLMKRLRDALEGAVPAGALLVLTCTAPILKDSATAVEAAERIGKMLSAGRARTKVAVNGNRLEARLLAGVGERSPKVIGYVHNSDVDPAVLFDVTEAALRALVTSPVRRAGTSLRRRRR